MIAAMRVRPSCLLLLSASLFALPACGGDDKRPPHVAHEDAAAQVRRVAARWTDTVEDAGFLENDPNGVLHFRILTTRTLALGETGAATLRVERDETYATKLGDFHCTSKGDVPGRAAYAWNEGEAEVRVALDAATLPRTCEQPGFPVPTKSLPAATMLFVLRSDRLVGKTNARDRSGLLPAQ
jgi:hypothetical protein